MAVRNPVIDFGQGASTTQDRSIIRVAWFGLATATNDTGAPVSFVEWIDWHIQFYTFNLATGAASTIDGTAIMSLYGSNDYIPVAEQNGNVANAGTWAILKDLNGTAVTTAATGAGQLFRGNERGASSRP
jgi:hypothetical protein